MTIYTNEMTKYANTIIYTIKHIQKNDLLYIGYTTNFNERLKQHKKDCVCETSCSYDLKVYRIIRENGGFNNFQMAIMKIFHCRNRTEALNEENRIINEIRPSMNSFRVFSPDEKKEKKTRRRVMKELIKYFDIKYKPNMYDWFIEKYRKTDAKNSYVPIKDIYNHWKESDLYKHMTKNEKRANSMKNFKQAHILENNEMRPYYIEKTNRKINDKIEHISNCLFGWEFISRV